MCEFCHTSESKTCDDQVENGDEMRLMRMRNCSTDHSIESLVAKSIYKIDGILKVIPNIFKKCITTESDID